MRVNWILEAVEFAIEAHKGQIRKYTGEPYVLHVIRVARHCYDASHLDEDMLIAALLHDVLEDCPKISKDEIKNKFGLKVLEIVVGLTDTCVVEGNRMFRKAKDRDRIINCGREVHTIKCADCIDNLPSIIENDPLFSTVFISENLMIIPRLHKADRALKRKALDMLYRYDRSIKEKDDE